MKCVFNVSTTKRVRCYHGQWHVECKLLHHTHFTWAELQRQHWKATPYVKKFPHTAEYVNKHNDDDEVFSSKFLLKGGIKALNPSSFWKAPFNNICMYC